MFFADEQINNYTTMVYGCDLCEMLGLFHDLAEAVNEVNIKKVAELERYKVAYNNRVRRDKRKEKETQEEKKRAEEDDEKFALIRKHNTDLLKQSNDLREQLNELKENFDLLYMENDEKDKYVAQLELDLKEKSHHADHLTQGVKMANEEAQEREGKMTQMKLERDIKEKEAAAHLALVEEKAKRVDELEKQMVLLNMDKEKLKQEVNSLSDQLVGELDNIAADDNHGGKKPKASKLTGFGAFNPMAVS